MANICISYAEDDAASVRELAYALTSVGHKVWRDNAARQSEDYQMRLQELVDAADAVVAVWSPAAITSPWVFEEAATAELQGKMIQVKLPDFADRDIPSPFNLRRALCVTDQAALQKAIVRIQSPDVHHESQLVHRASHGAMIWAGVLGMSLALSTPVFG